MNEPVEEKKPVKPKHPTLAADTRTYIDKVPREYVLQVLDYLHDKGDAISSVVKAGDTYSVYLQGASEERIDDEEAAAWRHRIRGFLDGVDATASKSSE